MFSHIPYLKMMPTHLLWKLDGIFSTSGSEGTWAICQSPEIGGPMMHPMYDACLYACVHVILLVGTYFLETAIPIYECPFQPSCSFAVLLGVAKGAGTDTDVITTNLERRPVFWHVPTNPKSSTLHPQPRRCFRAFGFRLQCSSLTAGRGWEISQYEPTSVRYNKQSQSLDSAGQSKHDVVTEL